MSAKASTAGEAVQQQLDCLVNEEDLRLLQSLQSDTYVVLGLDTYPEGSLRSMNNATRRLRRAYSSPYSLQLLPDPTIRS